MEVAEYGTFYDFTFSKGGREGGRVSRSEGVREGGRAKGDVTDELGNDKDEVEMGFD